MHKLILLILLTCAGVIRSEPQKSDEAQPDNQVFINATIHVGNGQVMEHAQFAIADGKITRAGYYRIAYTGDEIDLQGQHIYPGFILPAAQIGPRDLAVQRITTNCHEHLAAATEERALTAIKSASGVIPAMCLDGILLAQTTPHGGFINGPSAVLGLTTQQQSNAWIKSDLGMHVFWPAESTWRFSWLTFSNWAKPDPDRLEKINQIKQGFGAAEETSPNNRPMVNELKSVLKGNMKLFIHTSSANATTEAITYFQSLGLTDLVLVTDASVESVLPYVASTGVKLILSPNHSQLGPCGYPPETAAHLDAAARKAGILTALSYPGLMGSTDLADIAGQTQAHGIDSATALRMITLNPAIILGIDDQYGSLEMGKSATFFISQGDVFDRSARVITAAYVDGRKVALIKRHPALYEPIDQAPQPQQNG